MYTGRGSGRSCDACDQPIQPDQVEYEWESDDGSVVRFHLGCAALLEAEQRKRASS
jgi:hypothetical protein